AFDDARDVLGIGLDRGTRRGFVNLVALRRGHSGLVSEGNGAGAPAESRERRDQGDRRLFSFHAKKVSVSLCCVNLRSGGAGHGKTFCKSIEKRASASSFQGDRASDSPSGCLRFGARGV